MPPKRSDDSDATSTKKTTRVKAPTKTPAKPRAKKASKVSTEVASSTVADSAVVDSTVASSAVASSAVDVPARQVCYVVSTACGSELHFAGEDVLDVIEFDPTQLGNEHRIKKLAKDLTCGSAILCDDLSSEVSEEVTEKIFNLLSMSGEPFAGLIAKSIDMINTGNVTTRMDAKYVNSRVLNSIDDPLSSAVGCNFDVYKMVWWLRGFGFNVAFNHSTLVRREWVGGRMIENNKDIVTVIFKSNYLSWLQQHSSRLKDIKYIVDTVDVPIPELSSVTLGNIMNNVDCWHEMYTIKSIDVVDECKAFVHTSEGSIWVREHGHGAHPSQFWNVKVHTA